MKTVKTLILAAVAASLSGCGDEMAPPEVERAMRQGHSTHSRPDGNSADADGKSAGKRGAAKGRKGTSSSDSQFVIIPGQTKPKEGEPEQ